MLLNKGELEGTRVLSKKAVEQMTKNQVDELYSKEGLGFGLGFEIVDREGARGAFPEGTFGWGGAYGSRYWVVPDDRMVIVLMFQLLPNGTDFRDVIPDIVYRSLPAQGQ
jgi:CubicO group peptidase (beta-lactamase class C family)